MYVKFLNGMSRNSLERNGETKVDFYQVGAKVIAVFHGWTLLFDTGK